MEAPLAFALMVALVAPAVAIPHAPDAEWAIVQYDGPIAVEEQTFLRSIADVLDFAPPFGYVARLSQGDRDALLAREAVASIDPFVARAEPGIDGVPRVRVLLFPDVDTASLAEHLRREGAPWTNVPAAPEPFLDVEIEGPTLAHLLAHPEVRWIEALREDVTFDNERAGSIVQSGSNDAWPLHAAGVNGSSQLVAGCDSGLDTDAPQGLLAGRARHELFADAIPLAQNLPAPLHRKVALYYSPIGASSLAGDLDDALGHGTHVFGTLAGDAGTPGLRDGHDGVAVSARLVVCDIARGAVMSPALADHSGYFDPAYDAGARVHSNSWGTTPSSVYGIAARQQDAYVWAHRDLVILRSMGNSGPDGTMRPEAAAKSVLAIGSTTNDAASEAVVDSSSRGPAADGRVKPDLVAPGACITSADLFSPTSYVCWSGTSFATPVAAGSAALARDLYAKGLGPSGIPVDASSALVRATMIASAEPIAAAAPDGVEGWGRPELARALDDLALAQDEDLALTTGATWTTTIEVPAGATARIVLAWTDAPAAAGASIALVNDLDLELEAPGGAILRGNADLGAPDRANVVERIVATGLAGGTYTIRVSGWNVPMDAQPFALAAILE